ncbi:lytic polysaccharide monooxygenase [Micromonospora sp. PLK6-60]|uniref:lytic polysaccharide monooxygenase auxiliary activity family 9 protein n=1 Tax=Micromonospora sp. PLK6-60 TaxID=2873383 RepID=UPI001CA6FF54|nr:lytic polysaccharide monooxygenase [Micromonospora sp. PLK6-60]MBY8872248.1 lytic polysaccharide monooxygenase [Micromonospora sp. PLK6-60]
MAVRRFVAAVLAGAAAVLPVAGPAAAHGAPTSPVSRAAACGPVGRAADSPACRAAVAAGAAVREWDNVRVAQIDGRDRERIPDGELCSGGLSAYRGLDLARDDWPATELTPGARFTFRYRTTIPHRGTFRFYLTREGYQPGRRLTWADLPERPFLEATDPPVRDGAYQMPGRLPANRTGRHLIYTIWQNSNTQDTYYSCSDVVFRAPGGGATAGVLAAPPGDAGTTGAPATGRPAAGTEVPVAAAVTDERRGSLPWVAVAGGSVVLLAVLAGTRLRRAGTPPPGRACEVRSHRAGRRRVW